jgi:hypothetical protein
MLFPVIFALSIDYYNIWCVTTDLPKVDVLALYNFLIGHNLGRDLAAISRDLMLRRLRWYCTFFVWFFCFFYRLFLFTENLLPVEHFAKRSNVALDVSTVKIFHGLENLLYDVFSHLAFQLCEKNKDEQVRGIQLSKKLDRVRS